MRKMELAFLALAHKAVLSRSVGTPGLTPGAAAIVSISQRKKSFVPKVFVLIGALGPS